MTNAMPGPVSRHFCLISVGFILFILTWGSLQISAHAETVDLYVRRYLKGAPITLSLNDTGSTRVYPPAEISVGKQLFDESCKYCHVAGATIPNPPVSLSFRSSKISKLGNSAV